MDPATAALFIMELTCATQLALDSPRDVVTDATAQTPSTNQQFITLQGTNFGGPVKVIRAGKVVATFRQKDLKKIRAHPELDFRLQPDDVIEFAQTIF